MDLSDEEQVEQFREDVAEGLDGSDTESSYPVYM